MTHFSNQIFAVRHVEEQPVFMQRTDGQMVQQTDGQTDSRKFRGSQYNNSNNNNTSRKTSEAVASQLTGNYTAAVGGKSPTLRIDGWMVT